MPALAAIDTGDVTVVDGRFGEASIAAVARRFELPALLRVLRRRGYAPEDIWFESVRGAPASPGIVDSIRFEDAPRRVVVRLSTGLLGTDGPLPSYFRRFADELGDPRPLLAFVRFFDHVIAANLAYVAHPADGVALGSPLARAYQIIGGARSPGRVHALVRAIVPELALEVFPATLTRREPNDAARLGTAHLDGTAVVGWSQRTQVAGLVARLHAEVEHDDHGRPWADVVRERCERVLVPLVRRSARTVEIRLRVGSYGGRARLAQRPQLGIEPVTGGDAQTWEVPVLRIAGRG
ncbi:MAG: hypothetical protein E6J90_30255 [Deltaproteobacteria bacterium]|nr:MAG: hypothetical protein E6J90_30255 [Deltaproteobacteria bacterium]TMQ19931.1 MAG: hypothetical protein E6J91_05165 [Deltaproteobacteria bacterium]